MNFYRENEELIRTDKKQNVYYWDTIDTLVRINTIKCIEELVPMSLADITYDEEDEIDISKMVGDVIIGYLEKHCGAEFPYVDENF